MGLQQISKGYFLQLVQQCMFITLIDCSLRPYYLNFPPPLPIPNGLDPSFFAPNWPPNTPNNLTRISDIPDGAIPLIVHTWVKPDNSEGTTLQNGTVIYYVAGPWGGIRSVPISSPKPPQPVHGDLSNSITDSVYSTLRPNNLTPIPNSQSELGWQSPTIDITTPPPSTPTRQQEQNQDGAWGNMHYGFGWATSTKLYDNPPETTVNPTRSQIPETTTTSTTSSTSVAGTTVVKRKQPPSTTTVDPIAAETDARFPVSDSVRKFRRIVAQIRAITKKELQTEKRVKVRH